MTVRASSAYGTGKKKKRLCLSPPYPPTQHGTALHQGKRPLRCAPSSTPRPWAPYHILLPASHRLDLGMRPLRYAPPFKFMHSTATPFPWFGTAAIAVRPPHPMSIFRIVCWCVGSLSTLAFEETATIAVRPLPWIHPIPPCNFCLFCHRIDGFSGRESGQCGAPPFHTPIHYLTSLLPEVETLCHMVGAPPFQAAFPRKATSIISGYLAHRQHHEGGMCDALKASKAVARRGA